ncbi:MAG: DUF2079 domain-containing protein [bacterium]|nr:DUF2079 domain-containing protein [bacterium]
MLKVLNFPIRYSVILAVSGIISLFWAPKVFQKDIKDSLKWIYLIVGIYIVIMGSLSIFIYRSLYSPFYAYGFDLGVYDQEIWGYSKFRLVYTLVSIVGKYPFGDHFSPILFLLVPFYWIHSSPVILLLIQSVAIGLGAIFVYFIIKENIGNSLLAMIFPLVYLLYPSLQYPNLFDFHSLALAPLFLLATFYYSQKRNKLLAFIFTILALMCREDVSIVIASIGLYNWLAEKNKTIGILQFILGISWFILTVGFLVPAFNLFHVYPHFRLFHNSIEGASNHINSLKYVFPNIIAKGIKIFSISKIEWLLELLVPVGFLSLISWKTFLIIVPYLIMLLLGDNLAFIWRQTNFLLIPFLVISAAYGSKIILDKGINKSKLMTYVMLNMFLSCIIFGPLREFKYFFLGYKTNTTYRVEIKKIMEKIPKNSSVSTPNWCLIPHLSEYLKQRDNIHLFLIDQDSNKQINWGVDYILLDYGKKEKIPIDFSKFLPQIMESKKYEIIATSGEKLILFKKKTGSNELIKLPGDNF